jgi:hypothetical protein
VRVDDDGRDLAVGGDLQGASPIVNGGWLPSSASGMGYWVKVPGC